MRDLIRNYRMIIQGKTEDSESESEPMRDSSTSTSSSLNFGTFSEARIFRQEYYGTESEEELINSEKIYEKSLLAPLTDKNLIDRQMFLRPNYPTTETVYSNTKNITFQKYHYNTITDIYVDNDLISDRKSTASIEKSNYQDLNDSENKHTHNSLVTIFAIWNTTMGSSLLAMSWGLQKTGLFPGILINILVAGVCLYTCKTLLTVNEKHGLLGKKIEVPDLCGQLIGKWAEILAKIFSLIVLIGSNVVYWILMSNFLYNSVLFLHDFFVYKNTFNETSTILCPKQTTLVQNETNSIKNNPEGTIFETVWSLNGTVPIFLALIMFPLLNFKSPTFFTKFNSLGTISVSYLMIFVAVKSFGWGINLENWTQEFHLKPTFCALSGMLSLSYFIHNIIISIMRNNKHQEHNGRDLTIAFSLITFTYLFIGVVFYICFPLVKSCIEDNILNNFSKRDAMTLLARILLLFQLFTVFPLVAFMLRNDILVNVNMIFKNYRFGDFSYGRVVAINAVVVLVCILFACFLPKIGTLIRYTGALSGLVYIFMLPSLLKISSLKKEGSLTTPKLIFFALIIISGVLNLLSQFFISD